MTKQISAHNKDTHTIYFFSYRNGSLSYHTRQTHNTAFMEEAQMHEILLRKEWEQFSCAIIKTFNVALHTSSSRKTRFVEATPHDSFELEEPCDYILETAECNTNRATSTALPFKHSVLITYASSHSEHWQLLCYRSNMCEWRYVHLTCG